MDEVDIQALDVGLELWKFVEVVFSFREVVLILPKCDNFFEMLSVEAIFETNTFQRFCVPFTFGKTILQTSYSLKKDKIQFVQFNIKIEPKNKEIRTLKKGYI